MQSSLVVNASRTSSQSQRGRYMMYEFKTLKQKFGLSIAKQLRDDKKNAEENKGPGDKTTYWMKHPDLPQED